MHNIILHSVSEPSKTTCATPTTQQSIQCIITIYIYKNLVDGNMPPSYLKASGPYREAHVKKFVIHTYAYRASIGA